MTSPLHMPALNRRDLLRNALLLAGGSIVVGMPSDLFAATSKTAKQRFFSSAQFAVLDEVAEIILPQTDTPGARGVGVPAAFDALMQDWASEERRKQFREMLTNIDKAAIAEAGKPLLKLPAEKRVEVVTNYDKQHFAGDEVYRKFKKLVVTLYYYSEPGATQELRYEHVPGVWEPSIKVTPETRAWFTIDIL